MRPHRTEIMHRGRKVGFIQGRRFIHPKTPEHFFRIFQGFGISTTVLSQVEDVADYWVVKYIDAQEQLNYYILPMAEVRTLAQRYTDTSAGRPTHS